MFTKDDGSDDNSNHDDDGGNDHRNLNGGTISSYLSL